jgi:hypothetical protein
MWRWLREDVAWAFTRARTEPACPTGWDTLRSDTAVASIGAARTIAEVCTGVASTVAVYIEAVYIEVGRIEAACIGADIDAELQWSVRLYKNPHDYNDGKRTDSMFEELEFSRFFKRGGW